MSEFGQLDDITSVIFIKTTIKGIDRGWDPFDVIALLNTKGVNTKVVILDRLDELIREIDLNPNALFWPVCYSLAEDENARLIAEVFERAEVRFVGASSSSLRYSSKIKFKQALDGIPSVNTPSYILLDESEANLSLSKIDYPMMLKTEYSCNSEGVRKIESLEEFDVAFAELSSRYGQRIFAERWERNKEYTAAYLPSASGNVGTVAPVGMKILSNASYIDIPTKAASPLVEIVSLDQSETSEIQKVIEIVVEELSIDGHCRFDLLRNLDGDLFVIEANFQPFMSIPEHKRSYYPNALQKALGIEFPEQIHQIVSHAINRRFT